MAKKEKEIFKESMSWETSRIEQIIKSEKRAHRDKYIALGAVFVMAIAIALLTPLKEVQPYLIKENAQSGSIEIVGRMDVKNLSFDQVRDKYWVAQYVLSRETYDWYTLQNDYNKTMALSSSLVGTDFDAIYSGEKSLDKQYGANISSKIEVLSIVLNGSGSATVRFKRTTKRTDSQDAKVSVWVATIGYQYFSTEKMTEQQRLVNPFGFQVMSYRVDPELN